jgi:hypothetical protein
MRHVVIYVWGGPGPSGERYSFDPAEGGPDPAAVRVRVPAGWALADGPGGLVLQGLVEGKAVQLLAPEAHALAVLRRYGFALIDPHDP